MFNFVAKKKIIPDIEVYNLKQVNNVINKMKNRKIKYRAIFKVS